MKNALAIVFLFISTMCSAQVVDNNGPDADTVIQFDTDTIPFHYPYYGPRIPPWIGIVVGYEGFSHNCWEAGVAVHFAEFTSANAKGQMIGGMLTYKQSVSGRLHTIEAEIGFYTPFSLGFGFNENFYEGTRTFGFRPFVGTNFWHLQVMAGYNFYSQKQSDIAELDHFTVKIRYALPVMRIYKDIPNPGNNY